MIYLLTGLFSSLIQYDSALLDIIVTSFLLSLMMMPHLFSDRTMQEHKERFSKFLWLLETDKLRLKKNAHKELQYVDSKIGKEAVELGSVKNGGVHTLSNHRPDIIHQVPTHIVRCNGSSSSMNESAVDNKHRQSLRLESRFTFQNPQLERPISNLQPPQYDRVAEVVNDVSGRTMHSEKCFINGQHIKTSTTGPPAKDLQKVVHQEKTTDVYDKVIIVDNVSTAKEVARLLITKYKNLIHACDTEVNYQEHMI